jgi:hypothetical protein
MCYSAETSARTLIINAISSFILYMTYDPPMAIFLFSAGFMQFWDYIFWNNLGKNAVNYWATKMAMINNNIQPIIFALALYYYRNGKGFTKETLLILGIFSILFIFYVIYSWSKIDYTLVTKKSSPGLLWQWNYLKYGRIFYGAFLLVILYLLYHFYTYPMNIIFMLLGLFTFIFSFFKYNEHVGSGRFWCFYSAFLPIIVYLIYFLQDNLIW